MMSKCTKTCGNLQTSILSLKNTINGNYFRVQVQILYGYVLNGIKEGQKKKSVTAKECQLLHFLFVCVFVCMENYFQYLWSSLEWEVPNFPIDSFQYEKREFSTTTNFRSVTRTWTVSLCVCRVESGLCLSSYLCMYLC